MMWGLLLILDLHTARLAFITVHTSSVEILLNRPLVRFSFVFFILAGGPAAAHPKMPPPPSLSSQMTKSHQPCYSLSNADGRNAACASSA